MSDNNKAMRKLKLHVGMSIDGCIAGPNNEMDWIDFTWDEKFREYEDRLHEPVDTILLGRKMTDDFITTWSNFVKKPDDPWYPFAKKMIETPKVVFTKTLKVSKWVNTVLATGDLTDEIMKLKSESGKDIIVYGGATFDSSLIKAGLIDEFHLLIEPAAIGSGMAIFKDLKEVQKFTMIKTTPFDSGIVELHFEPKRN